MASNVNSDVEHFTYHSRLQWYSVLTMKVFVRYKTERNMTENELIYSKVTKWWESCDRL